MLRHVTALVLLASLLAASASAAEPRTAPGVDEAVVGSFVAWWGNTTCSYAAGADCTTAGAVKDAIGIAALGVAPATWPAEDRSVVKWILEHPDEWDDVTALGPGPSLAMTILALEGSGQDPRAVAAGNGSRDLVAELAAHAGADGYGSTNADSWALFGFNVAGVSNETALDVAEALEGKQRATRGWAWDDDQDPDPDTTAWAVTALAPHPDFEDAVRNGLSYLRQQQLREDAAAACWPGFGGTPSAASTSVVLGALVATDQSLEEWSVDGRSPMDCLVAFQEADGSFATAFEPYQTARALGGVPLGWPTSDDPGPDPTEPASNLAWLPIAGALLAAVVFTRRRS